MSEDNAANVGIVGYRSKDLDDRAPYVITMQSKGRVFVLMDREKAEPEIHQTVAEAEERVHFIQSGEVDPEPQSSDCFITSACAMVMGEKFRDDSIELETLRLHRDRLKEARAELAPMVDEYYESAPSIVRAIESSGDGETVYRRIFADMVKPTNALLSAGDDDGAVEVYYREFARLRERYLG